MSEVDDDEEAPPGDRGECVFCGRELIINDAARDAYHEAPVCEQFKLAVLVTGGEARGSWTSEKA
jgi:hypothetical protein